MRILVLTHEYPPVGGGGAKIIEDLCRGLANRGHELRVLTTHLDGIPREEEVDNVQIFRLPCGREVPYRARFNEMARYVASSFWQGLRLVRLWKPDIMHVHFAVPAGASALGLSILTRVPYILTIHGGDVPGGAPEKTGGWFRVVYPFTPPIWRSAARIVAVSKYTRELALQHYPVEIQVINNGFDLEALNPGEIEVGNPPRVIWAGRFMAEKNPLQVVRTLADLRHISWKCVMIGDGPVKPQVESEIARLNLSDRIVVPGWMSQEEVMAWFAKSDVLFMPSFNEGLPIVGLQALALGLAIVATSVGGLLELVEHHQNGYLVESATGDGFVKPLKNLLSDPLRLKDFRKASLKTANRFDIRRVIQAYDDLIQDMV